MPYKPYINHVDGIMGAVGDTVYFSTEHPNYEMYAYSPKSNSTFELTNFPEGEDYETGSDFFLHINGTIYMNGGYDNSLSPPRGGHQLVAWSPYDIVSSTTPVSGATCSVSPALPAGLSLNQGNCTVSGTPTSITSSTNYTLTATINGQTYGGTFFLITDYMPMKANVAELEATLGAPIVDIVFNGIGQPGDGGYGDPVTFNHPSIYIGHDGYCFIQENGKLLCDGDNEIEGTGSTSGGLTVSSSSQPSLRMPLSSTYCPGQRITFVQFLRTNPCIAGGLIRMEILGLATTTTPNSRQCMFLSLLEEP